MAKPDMYMVISNDADESQAGHGQTFVDYFETFELSGIDGVAKAEIGVLEVNMEDVLSAFHEPDGCPICAAAASGAGAAVSASGTASGATDRAYALSTTNTTSATGATGVAAAGDREVDALLMGDKWSTDIANGVTYPTRFTTARLVTTQRRMTRTDRVSTRAPCPYLRQSRTSSRLRSRSGTRPRR